MSMEARVTASRRLAAKLLEMSQSTREEPVAKQAQHLCDQGRLSSLFQAPELAPPERAAGALKEQTQGHTCCHSAVVIPDQPTAQQATLASGGAGKHVPEQVSSGHWPAQALEEAGSPRKVFL